MKTSTISEQINNLLDVMSTINSDDETDKHLVRQLNNEIASLIEKSRQPLDEITKELQFSN